MRTVRFYCMRHGQKDGDALTALGVQQVVASAKCHLAGLTFEAMFYSGMTRAKQTAETALDAIGHWADVKREEGFGYTWYMNDKEMPAQPAQPPVYATIGEYFQNGFLLATATRGRVWQTLLDRARDLALRTTGGQDINVLVASHSPTIETAVPEPNSFPRLNEADLVVYEVTVDSDDYAQIKSARYLAAPAVTA